MLNLILSPVCFHIAEWILKKKIMKKSLHKNVLTMYLFFSFDKYNAAITGFPDAKFFSPSKQTRD